jgi:hypothetical protein
MSFSTGDRLLFIIDTCLSLHLVLTGAVFKQYQAKPIANGGKAILNFTIPEKEEQITTKDVRMRV